MTPRAASERSQQIALAISSARLQAAERDLAGDVGGESLGAAHEVLEHGVLVDQVGVHRARAHCVDRDAGRTELERHRLRQQDDTRLGGAVRAEEREGPLAGLARHVADPAADALGHHALGAGLRDEPGAHDVHVEHAAELVGRHAEQGAEAEPRPTSTRHVGDQADGAQRVGDGCHRRLHGRLVGDVGHRRRGPHPQRLELGHQRGQVVAAGRAVRRRLVVGARDVDHPDVGAPRRQLQCRGPPDAAGPRRARDQRHLAREPARPGSVCETHRANVAGGAPVQGVVPACGPR